MKPTLARLLALAMAAVTLMTGAFAEEANEFVAPTTPQEWIDAIDAVPTGQFDLEMYRLWGYKDKISKAKDMRYVTIEELQAIVTPKTPEKPILLANKTITTWMKKEWGITGTAKKEKESNVLNVTFVHGKGVLGWPEEFVETVVCDEKGNIPFEGMPDFVKAVAENWTQPTAVDEVAAMKKPLAAKRSIPLKLLNIGGEFLRVVEGQTQYATKDGWQPVKSSWVDALGLTQSKTWKGEWEVSREGAFLLHSICCELKPNTVVISNDWAYWEDEFGRQTFAVLLNVESVDFTGESTCKVTTAKGEILIDFGWPVADAVSGKYLVRVGETVNALEVIERKL